MSKFDADTLARALEFVAKGGDTSTARDVVHKVKPPEVLKDKPKVQPSAKPPVKPSEAPTTAPAVPSKAQDDTYSKAGIDPVAIAAELARRFEGLYLKPYICPAGVPTIGYGATYYMDGTRVTLKDPPLTKAQAEALLLWMVKSYYLPIVLKLCPNVREAKRLAMLIDFAFNLGGGRLQSSTLRKKVNADDWDAVPAEILKWDKANGKVLAGLTKRCVARVQLITET